MAYVTDINAYDVLFGRGSGPNDHEGNVRFRHLVAERKEEYMSTNHRLTKAKIAREIVDQILSCNGRFLKKMEDAEMKKYNLTGIDAWTVVDEETVMEKAKQALRQNPSKATGKEKAVQEAPQSTAGSHISSVPLQQIPPSVGLDTFDIDPVPIGAMSGLPTQIGVAGNNIPAMQPGYGNVQNSTPMWQQAQSHQNSSLDFTDTISNLVPGHHPVNLTSTYISEGSPSVGQIGGDEEPGPLPTMLFNPRSSVTSTDPENRRGSISISDLMKMHRLKERAFERVNDRNSNEPQSMNMDDLVDSFSKSKISTEDTKKFYASSDTMGTIEHLGGASANDMSFGTINSSTFSFHNKDSSIQEDRPVPDIDIRAFAGMAGESSQKFNPRGSVMSDTSMSAADLRGRRVSQTKPAMATDGSIGVAPLPSAGGNSLRPIGVGMDQSLDLEGMGNSSVEMLKGMLFSSNDLQDVDPQRQQQGDNGNHAS